MTMAIFINTSKHPFVDQIMLRLKLYETRNRNTLGRFLGERILLAETGHGKPIARGTAEITEVIEVYTQEAWEKYRNEACIPAGSDYDWKPNTKKKVLYRLSSVTPCEPFRLPEGIRHGRICMEYEGSAI